MKRRIAAALLVPLLATPALADADYRCSGIGAERQVEETNFPHTLKLVYAQPDGSFLGYVATRIDGPGGAAVVETTCEGPWLLADLPAGRYEVTAAFEGGSKTVSVDVPGRGGVAEKVITF